MMNPGSEQKLRQGFRFFNRFMLLLWRLGLGRWLNLWPSVGGRIMVITHTGRRSGKRRRTPVNYALVNDEIYCLAGFGKECDWFRNILANPQVEVWLPDGRWAGEAEDISDSMQRLPILRQVMIASGFAAYAAGLKPLSMSDEELAAVTATYRLIHIRRRAACTGLAGPGDLDWIWPLATCILLPMVLFHRRRR